MLTPKTISIPDFDLNAIEESWLKSIKDNELLLSYFKYFYESELTSICTSIKNEQIKLALSAHCFNFKNEIDLLKFLKNKAELINQNSIETLFIDKKPICQWDLNPVFKYSEGKITATYGFFKIINQQSHP